MIDESVITVDGYRLSAEESAIIRMAVETFSIIMTQRIEVTDEGVTQNLTEPYVSALVAIRTLLDIPPEHTVQ